MSKPETSAEELADYARQAHEAIRTLNHLTRGASMYPAEAYTVLGNLQAAAAGMPQLLQQLGQVLERAKQDYLLTVDSGEWAADPGSAMTAAGRALDRAGLLADELWREIEAAQTAIAFVTAHDR